MNDRSLFERDWLVSPGTTVQDIMSSRQMLHGDVSAQLDLTLEGLEELIGGRMAIDQDLASRLAGLFGPSALFWIKREKLFRQPPNPCAESLPVAQAEFLDQLPLRDMTAFGWLAPYDRASKRDAALSFFEDDYGDWRRNGRDVLEAVAFRTSVAHETNAAAVAAWLRQGVIQAQALECSNWDRPALADAVSQMKVLTRIKEPELFFPKLVELGRSVGVAIVFVRTPTGCRASGATHFSTSGTPIVQLSFRYRSDDHFWFTVFHEIGHLILHASSPMFVEGGDYISGEEEAQADRFAQDALIAPELQGELPGLGKDFKKVMRFAKRAGVSPGIVVGQMQKRGLVRYDQLNFLKVRYDWSQMRTVSP
jgi:HTH-type transcriptional regulator/antitoxin HigA